MARRSPTITSLAQTIDPDRAALASARLAPALGRGTVAHAIATLLSAAYPSLGQTLESAPEIARALAADAQLATRDRAGLLARIVARIGSYGDGERVQRELRRAARDERIRIALREVLPHSLGGADVDVTARELSALADATIQIALDEAVQAVTARFGPPLASSGAAARFVVLGMGKLGGHELNAGSDVDLIYFYDTDDGGAVRGADASKEISLHDFWTRVARRMTATLEQVTADGFVWRVDLRLRPEGRSGPLVNSLAAAERYYEAFGRLWERAALLRSRPVATAGNPAFGDEVMETLAPFVWRRRVDPRIAGEMLQLVQRARAELSSDPSLDLKLGPGGIREAEFFVQSLQLVWGGKEPRVRAANTLDGLRKLRAAGFVTDREAQEIAMGYLALRRAEHAVQSATGVQTHARPSDPAAAARLGRALGFADAAEFEADIAEHMARVSARFLSLSPEGASRSSRFTPAIAALDSGDRDAFAEAIARAAGVAELPIPDTWADLAGDLIELARHPDAPLGSRSREIFPNLAETVLAAVVEAADPEQAARYLRTFFARIGHPGVYTRLLGDEPRVARRLVEALGASMFLGDTLANNPELGDTVLFARGAPSPELARDEIDDAVAEAEREPGEDPEEAFVAALRRAKSRVTIEIALADLASQIGTREATLALSALADGTLEAATRHALHTPKGERVRGLAVIGMGKLGGREIGYGSDLDVIFLFDPAAAPAHVDPHSYFARAARRVIRLISVSHGAGPGYELDTRLRPSGNQGMLITSLEGFARYHSLTLCDGRWTAGAAPPRSTTGAAPPSAPLAMGRTAAAWERLALLRARAVAGDPELGVEAMRALHAAAYDMPSDRRTVAEEIYRLRMRLERENSQERAGRYDVKLGRGGLVDVEFSVQLLQLKNGRDPRVRTTETAVAIDALAASGYLAAPQADALREGYAFLRKLEQRMRILHNTVAQLLAESAPGLPPLARRMGVRERRGVVAGAELLGRYRAVTERVRGTFEAIVGAEIGAEIASGGSGAGAT